MRISPSSISVSSKALPRLHFCRESAVGEEMKDARTPFDPGSASAEEFALALRPYMDSWHLKQVFFGMALAFALTGTSCLCYCGLTRSWSKVKKSTSLKSHPRQTARRATEHKQCIYRIGLALWVARDWIWTQIDRAKKQSTAALLDNLDGPSLKRICGNVSRKTHFIEKCRQIAFMITMILLGLSLYLTCELLCSSEIIFAHLW